MNYIKHLTGFFERVAKDNSLNPTHVSLYMALFQYWNFNRFRNPISISRDELMRISKISSKATYHKCLKNLHTLRYVDYQPSYNPFKGSQVIMFNFSSELRPSPKYSTPKIEPNTEQVVNKSYTSDEASTVQALAPYINTINSTNKKNNLNLEAQAQSFSENNTLPYNQSHSKKEKSCAKKEKEILKTNVHSDSSVEIQEVTSIPLGSLTSTPQIDDVKIFFQENNFPELEAQKYFNYFTSNGWLVGGKSKMKDWQAAARNWMLNSKKFNTDGQLEHRAKHLNTTTGKNYSEPL